MNHKHDCNECHFMGSAILELNLYDFYFCQKSIPTVVVRYGNEQESYSSLMYSILQERNGNPVWKYANSLVEKMLDNRAYDMYAD